MVGTTRIFLAQNPKGDLEEVDNVPWSEPGEEEGALLMSAPLYPEGSVRYAVGRDGDRRPTRRCELQPPAPKGLATGAPDEALGRTLGFVKILSPHFLGEVSQWKTGQSEIEMRK